MRFLVIVKATKDSEAGKMPSEELLSAMAKFNEEMVKAGVMLDGNGLQPSSKGARVRFSGDRRHSAGARGGVFRDRAVRSLHDDGAEEENPFDTSPRSKVAENYVQVTDITCGGCLGIAAGLRRFRRVTVDAGL
jgi:hypothetical protein